MTGLQLPTCKWRADVGEGAARCHCYSPKVSTADPERWIPLTVCVGCGLANLEAEEFPAGLPAAPAAHGTDPAGWPFPARIMARFREPDDRGVGDTAARVFARFGADRAAHLLQRLTGVDCKCADRRAWLNCRYPYG